MTPVAICFVMPQCKISVLYGPFKQSKQATWSSADNVWHTV